MSPRLSCVTAAELLRALRRASWEPFRQTGSHAHLIHADHPGVVLTVAAHAGRIVPVGALRAILARAGLSADQLRELL